MKTDEKPKFIPINISYSMQSRVVNLWEKYDKVVKINRE